MTSATLITTEMETGIRKAIEIYTKKEVTIKNIKPSTLGSYYRVTTEDGLYIASFNGKQYEITKQ